MWFRIDYRDTMTCLFVLSCTDNEGTLEKRLAVRPQHIERLQKLDDEGRLVAAGAMPKDLMTRKLVLWQHHDCRV